ncbi:hypothetical protein AB0D59_11590 [Streptomyces sp. NPDC048417]|uniref:hypothetical protein n=1 Tax=Streptomyces sp. NPDC048417 TaxID=3155387 RepID=UPI003437CACE
MPLKPGMAPVVAMVLNGDLLGIGFHRAAFCPPSRPHIVQQRHGRTATCMCSPYGTDPAVTSWRRSRAI